jgi:hypothetical protein
MIKIEKNIVLFFITIMVTQYMPIEGDAISNFKFGAMTLCPLIWILNFKTFSKSSIICLLYITSFSFSSLVNYESFRLSTYGYKLSFVFMFIMAYDLIYIKKALNLLAFEDFIKKLIFVFVFVLILQQIAIIFGITRLEIINLFYFLDRGIGANSLTLEPSHAARILTVLILAYFRILEIKFGKKLNLDEIFRYDKKLFIGFIWSMLTMGSGTAFICLAILSMYFIRGKSIIKISFIFAFLYLISVNTSYEPVERAIATIESATTFDNNKIIEADANAAQRILPLINTLRGLDFSDSNVWYGKGIDSNISEELYSEAKTVGDIKDYGLISYVLSLVLVFSLCIRKFFSIETLIFVTLLSASVVNIPYNWGILIILCAVRFFQEHNSKQRISDI